MSTLPLSFFECSRKALHSSDSSSEDDSISDFTSEDVLDSYSADVGESIELDIPFISLL